MTVLLVNTTTEIVAHAQLPVAVTGFVIKSDRVAVKAVLFTAVTAVYCGSGDKFHGTTTEVDKSLRCYGISEYVIVGNTVGVVTPFAILLW